MSKQYLGDSVYVDKVEGSGGLVLTTENGVEASNIIFLDDSMVAALLEYIKKCQEE